MTNAPHASGPYVFGLAGWSGSGKTTLAEKLIAKASEEGVVISSIKHAHHKFDPDISGKDSWRHRQAGARQVLVASANRSALFTENKAPVTPQLDDLLMALGPCDMVLVEGFKTAAIPKIEIYAKDVNAAALFATDPHIMAVTGTQIPDGCDLPFFHRDDVASIFAFLRGKADLS